jgi:tRNA pseudouridine38-40 synthase
MTVAYDGAGFHGFAENAGVRTVAGDLRVALRTVTGAPVEIACAGRTDTGVHAHGQVISCTLPDGAVLRSDRPALADEPDTDPAALDRLRTSLNALLAPSVVVREVTVADPSFDARFSARARTYRYHVWNSPVPEVFLARTSWWVADPLDRAVLEASAAVLVGEHDFSTFCRRPRGADDVSLVRRVLSAEWSEPEPELLRFTITATAFCHQMVRSIVGLLVAAGRGRRTPDQVREALEARDRSTLPTLAPPQGLTLWQVTY